MGPSNTISPGAEFELRVPRLSRQQPPAYAVGEKRRDPGDDLTLLAGEDRSAGLPVETQRAPDLTAAAAQRGDQLLVPPELHIELPASGGCRISPGCLVQGRDRPACGDHRGQAVDVVTAVLLSKPFSRELVHALVEMAGDQVSRRVEGVPAGRPEMRHGRHHQLVHLAQQRDHVRPAPYQLRDPQDRAINHEVRLGLPAAECSTIVEWSRNRAGPNVEP